MLTRRNLLSSGLTAGFSLSTLTSRAEDDAPPVGAKPGRVRTGLEVLMAHNFQPLAGLKLGLVTNPTGILPNLTTTIEALHQTKAVSLKALFGPEHGVRGDVPAGQYIPSTTDTLTGLPVYSLYGKTKSPTTEMVRGLDALVFDIQDIGARSYTYVSTLGAVMDGAARLKLPVIVLDRPNPCGLNRVEGGPTKPGFSSFVSKYPMAYLHGMTLGEVAKMVNGEGWLSGKRQCELTVVRCENLTREMATWEAFGGLPWVPTSPHVPQSHTAHYYAATGIAGELSALSIGIGYPLPFELAGAPEIGPVSMTREMERRNVPGVAYRPHTWIPYYGAYKGQRCGGVHIYLTDPATAPLTRLNFEILDALRTLDKGRAFFTSKEASRMFDLSCGVDKVRTAFQSGANATTLWEIFNEGRDAFIAARKPYRLYL